MYIIGGGVVVGFDTNLTRQLYLAGCYCKNAETSDKNLILDRCR